MILSDRWRSQTLFFRGTTGNMSTVCRGGFLPNLLVVCTVRFKLLDMFMNLFFHMWLLLFIILFTCTWHCLTLCWINFQSSFSIATCFRSLVFCSSFLLVYSSVFVYLFASSDQMSTCKFTLCCVFQLVHRSLRNIVIYFLSVKPLFLYCDCHSWSSNIDFKYRLQMRSDYLLVTSIVVSITWNIFSSSAIWCLHATISDQNMWFP